MAICSILLSHTYWNILSNQRISANFINPLKLAFDCFTQNQHVNSGCFLFECVKAALYKAYIVTLALWNACLTLSDKNLLNAPHTIVMNNHI